MDWSKRWDTVVLDRSYRYPHHSGPDEPLPEAARVVDRETDPAVLAEVQALIAEFVELYRAIRGRPPELGSGRDEAEVLVQERRLGVRLPEDLRALYRTVFDDDREEAGLLGRFLVFPLEGLVELNRHGRDHFFESVDDLFGLDEMVFEAYPHGTIRRVSRSRGWIAFANDHGGQAAAVDLNPGPLGRSGQLLAYGRSVGDGVRYVGPSVLDKLRTTVAIMRATREDWSWMQDTWDETPYRWSPPRDSTDLAAAVAQVPDPATVQRVYLGAAHPRLADLAPFGNLRAIHLNGPWPHGAPHADLALAPGQPAEMIDVTAQWFDPAALVSTPTLWSVTLAGNTDPVEIAALAALPNLARLDLSSAKVADIASIASLPALRVLLLHIDQWHALRASGRSPAALAGAAMTGGPPGWRDWIVTGHR